MRWRLHWSNSTAPWSNGYAIFCQSYNFISIFRWNGLCQYYTVKCEVLFLPHRHQNTLGGRALPVPALGG